MFGFFRRDIAQLQLYGKLPIAKDYLRIGCSEGSTRPLRAWLDRAYSGAVDAEDAFELAFPMRFLAAATDGPPLQGSLWPSSDAGGLRRFPFVVAIERKPKALLIDLKEGLARADGLWPRIEAVFAAHENYGDGRAFLAALRGREIDANQGEAHGAPPVDLESWTAALWPERGQEGLDETLDALGAVAARKGREPIRLPLASGLSITAQVHAWWRVITELRLAPADSVPTLFFPQPTPPGDRPLFLTLLRGPLRIEDRTWLGAPLDASCGGARREAGDFCDSVPRRAAGCAPASENAASLADSLSGAIAGFRGRSRHR